MDSVDTEDSVAQSIKDTVKKRLKSLSEQNTKLNDSTFTVKPNPVSLSLYSDEELETSDIKIKENVETNPDENNGTPTKRIFRTDRTKNTDSELSEGEIVDDDDDDIPSTALQKQKEKSREIDKAKNLMKSNDLVNSNDHPQRPPPNFHNNHKHFDLRQRIETSRGRFRGSLRGRFQMRGRGNLRIKGGPRRSRSRSRHRHSSRDKKSREKKSPPKGKISKSALLSEIAASKASTKSESTSGKSLKEKLKIGLTSSEISSSMNTVDELEKIDELLKKSKAETKKSHKHSRRKDKKHEKRLKGKPLLETAKVMTTFLPDDDEEIIELKRKIIDLQAELGGETKIETQEDSKVNTSHVDSTPCTPERPPASKDTSIIIKQATPLMSPVKEPLVLEKNSAENESEGKLPNRKEQIEKSPDRHKRKRTQSTSEISKVDDDRKPHKKEHKEMSPDRHKIKQLPSTSEKPKIDEDRKLREKNIQEQPKNDKPKKHTEDKRDIKHRRSRSKTPLKSISKTPREKRESSEVKKNQNTKSDETIKAESKKKDEPQNNEFFVVQMSDESIKEIPIALVKYTTTLPKIMYSPRLSLTPVSKGMEKDFTTKATTIPPKTKPEVSDVTQNHDKNKEHKKDSKPASKELPESKKTSNKKQEHSIKASENKEIIAEKRVGETKSHEKKQLEKKHHESKLHEGKSHDTKLREKKPHDNKPHEKISQDKKSHETKLRETKSHEETKHETKSFKHDRNDSPTKTYKSVPRSHRSRSRSRKRTETSIVSDSKKEIKKTPIKSNDDRHKDHHRSESKTEKSDRDRTKERSHHEKTNHIDTKSTKDAPESKHRTISDKSTKESDKKDSRNEKRRLSPCARQSDSRKPSDSKKISSKTDNNSHGSSAREKSVERKKTDDHDKSKKRSETKEHGKSSNEHAIKIESHNHSSRDSKKISESHHSDKTPQKDDKKDLDRNKKHRSPLRSDSSKSTSTPSTKNKTKVKHEQKPTLSFFDELPEVQGLKPAKEEDTPVIENKRVSFSPKVEPQPPALSCEAPVVKEEKSISDDESRKKKSEHAEMLKKVESTVEEILAPLSEIEKLALDRKSLKPEDLLNKMMDLFTPEKINVDSNKEFKNEIKHDKPKQEFSLYDPIDPVTIDGKFVGTIENATQNCIPIKVMLESEYETFIKSIPITDGKSEEPNLDAPVAQETTEVIKPKKKISRSLSQSTSSSHTSGTTTTSSNNSSSESSSSSDSDSSGSSSSESDSDSSDSSDKSNESDIKVKEQEVKAETNNIQQPEKEIVSPSQTPPRDLIKVEVSSTMPPKPELVPLPEHRDKPIKIQMNFVQKMCTINKTLNEEVPESEPDQKEEESKEKTDKRKRSRSKSPDKRKSSDKKSSTTRDKRSKESDKRRRSRSGSRSSSQKKSTDKKSSSTRDKKSREDDRKRTRTQDDDRRYDRSTNRSNKRRRSLSPIRSHRRSRDRSLRRSNSRSPIRRSRRSSPRHHRPRSPRTPPRFSRSRSYSRSPHRLTWSRYDDYRRPPSPQSDTESPVAGFKRSLADSTISDAELERQQLYKIETHMTTEGFYSYMDPDMHTMPSNEMHGSPRRISLDDRINMALGQNAEPKYGYPEDYRYNNYQNSGPAPFHSHPQQLQYRYDPAVYNAPPPAGYDPNMPHYRYNNCQIPPMHHPQQPPPHLIPPRGPYINREFPMVPHHPRNIKPLQQVPLMPNHMGVLQQVPFTPNHGGVVQKGNVLEIVPTAVDSGQMQEKPQMSQEQSVQPKKKLVFTAEELQLRKDRKLELRKKRKAERDKKRLEKKMRKEKLKLEIKRLVSMGVKDEISSSDEDAPFDDIDRKGMYGTKDRGILKNNEKPETVPVKKSVKFADGILPGYGSSYSDNEQKPEMSPSLLNVSEKRKKKLNKRKKSQNNENTEKKTETVQELAPFPIEMNIPPELEHAQPPPPPEGNPLADLPQPRYLYPNRVPMLFFHLVRPTLHQPPPHHLLPGQPGFNHANPSPHQSPALSMNFQPQAPNKLTPNSRVNQLPPTFAGNKSSLVYE